MLGPKKFHFFKFAVVLILGRGRVQSRQMGTSGTIRPETDQALQGRLRLHWTALSAKTRHRWQELCQVSKIVSGDTNDKYVRL